MPNPAPEADGQDIAQLTGTARRQRPRYRPEPRHPPFATPALDCWRREVRRGERTRTAFDALHRAACAEMSAREAAALGFHASARDDLDRARAILRDAAKATA